MSVRLERTKRRRRNRRVLLVVILAVAGGLVGYGVLRPGADEPGPATTASLASEPPREPQASSAPNQTPAAAPKVPTKGSGTFGYAAGKGKVLGAKGKLRTFTVAVEKGMGASVPQFAARVEAILGDPRSWIAGRNVRLQRVPKGTSGTDFTVYLASPTTSEKMCREDGLYTEKYTSCRLGSGKVVINLARWLTAVPDYGAPLEDYQAYAINHEVGHQLGHGHEGCPAKGRTAPVMQQQTLGLKGCVANAWPYVDGKRYAGPAIP
ncbi:DUF3152 domain-containing protein [Luedemannella helvata]|uniref:DUF3152 domain-containing protein n=1 Tax=Luedemannella helvata TaxID=349315 RepID=A0ABN2L3K7_9ACTN